MVNKGNHLKMALFQLPGVVLNESKVESVWRRSAKRLQQRRCHSRHHWSMVDQSLGWLWSWPKEHAYVYMHININIHTFIHVHVLLYIYIYIYTYMIPPRDPPQSLLYHVLQDTHTYIYKTHTHRWYKPCSLSWYIWKLVICREW